MFGGHFWSINNFPFLKLLARFGEWRPCCIFIGPWSNGWIRVKILGKELFLFAVGNYLFLLNRVIKRTTSMSTATLAVIVSDFILSDIDCDYHLEMHDAISLHDSLCDPNQINTDLNSHLSKCERKNEVLRFNQSVNFHSRQSKS